MVREAKLAWNDLGRSSLSEIGLRKLWIETDDIEDPLTPGDTTELRSQEESSEKNRSEKQNTARRKNARRNLADADWMNWD